MIFKVVLISAIILLLVFLLRLAFHVKKKKTQEEISIIQLFVDIIGIFISVLISLYSGISLGESPSIVKTNSVIDTTYVSENKTKMQDNIETCIEEESFANDVNTTNDTFQQNTDPYLPSDGSCNVSFVGQGLDLSGCKIGYRTSNNSGNTLFNEIVITDNYDGGWYNAFLPSNEDLLFFAWKNNELVGSSYGMPIHENENQSIFIFPNERMGIPVILKFEGKNGLDIIGCMITISINNSSTLHTPITESYNGKSLLFFVKPDNYEIDCWKDDILISKTNWYFDEAWSISTVFFYPLD